MIPEGRSEMTDWNSKYRTLALLSVLHGFTHLYQMALLPLYLPMQQSFKLQSVGSSTFLVTLMMLAYFVPSYPMGVLADRVSRKKLLTVGLAINGLGFIGLAVARHFPVNTGRALGFLGVGAGAGFFLGPIYAGWRAGQAGDWRAPVLELGALGLVGAGLFYWLAQDTPAAVPVAEPTARGSKLFTTRGAAVLFVAAAFAFALRDFTGSSMASLGSLYLQQAHGFSVKQTGVVLSGIFLASIISNPLFGHLSDGGRKRWTCLVLGMAAALVALFPHLPGGNGRLLFFVFMAYGFFFMASYPMVEAGVMQAVRDLVRGRAFGLWITIGGLSGNLSHWLMGHWVEGFGRRAALPEAYYSLYGLLAIMLVTSLVGLPCLQVVGQRERVATSPGREDSAIGLPHSALE